jgi:hypothetical protein
MSHGDDGNPRSELLGMIVTPQPSRQPVRKPRGFPPLPSATRDLIGSHHVAKVFDL